MKYIRIYADENGDSHLEDVAVTGEGSVPTAPGRSVVLTGPFPATEITFLEMAAEQESLGNVVPDPHVAPRRQWVIVLSGRGLLTTTDGNERQLAPGDVVFAEDTTGRGHWTTPLTSDLCLAMIPAIA